MSRTTTVHLLRHGEVDNPTGVLYGQLPGFHLSPNGRRMAARAAEFFAGVPLAALISSPLERAQETIAPVAALNPGLEVQLEPDVIEATSVFEGQVFGPGHHALRDPHNWKYLRNPLRPSWGEPYTHIAARMQRAILAAARQVGEGGQALIVSHQLPIWIAHLSAEGRRLAHDPRNRVCTLGSVTSFGVLDGRIVRVDYAEPSLDLIPKGARRANISAGSAAPAGSDPAASDPGSGGPAGR
ncbi:MAG: histidine phosphatase family protein [Acidipropionibacterium jensenii]|uniref:histidine phosphatase family protein n=1 Tax=Acidipropionibacterium jensenii TaxID=1749 RepID=UPI0026476368|nr:histidine phosphatase family protein [Acidipropionibacterium jensenii]MDN6479931.1 histidine phosphatase family protein [Acidipropionibacterium jensenii]